MDWMGSFILPQKNQMKRQDFPTKGCGCGDKKAYGSYSCFKYSEKGSTKYYLYKIQDIIADNHFNSKPSITTSTGSYDWLNRSYIAFVEKEEFLSNPQKYKCL